MNELSSNNLQPGHRWFKPQSKFFYSSDYCLLLLASVSCMSYCVSQHLRNIGSVNPLALIWGCSYSLFIAECMRICSESHLLQGQNLLSLSTHLDLVLCLSGTFKYRKPQTLLCDLATLGGVQLFNKQASKLLVCNIFWISSSNLLSCVCHSFSLNYFTHI